MAKKLRIAFIAACPFPYPRGGPVRIYRMAEALSKTGHEVHVITYHLGNRLDNAPFKIHRIPNMPFYKKLDPGPTYSKVFIIDLFLALKILNTLVNHRFDIIHAHHYEGMLSVLPARLFSRIPIIFDVHTLLQTELHHYDLFLSKSIKSWIAVKLDRVIPKFANHIISVSEEIQNQLIQDAKIASEKISVIPNGVDLEMFLREIPESNRNKSRELVLAYAGNLSPYQRIDLLLEAFLLIKDNNPKIMLEIHTEDDVNKIKTLVMELGLEENVRISFTSFIDLPKGLARADILVNPRPDGIGLPIKMLNYMAAGKAIVSFSGSAHVMIHQQTGWVVNGESATELADGILCLVEDEKMRSTLGANARKFVKENFNWSAKSESISEIYYQLLGDT